MQWGPLPATRVPVGVLCAALLVAMAGCSEAAAQPMCEPVPGDRATVESLSDTSAAVRLPDGEPAVLHLPQVVFMQDAAGCTQGVPADLRVGDELAFVVEQWAVSYPMQGWPERVVALRA